jgi:1,3,6,8-tetrahydroxynaphthalene synthase
VDIGSLLSDGLFGDAVAAAVVRGRGGRGLGLERNASYLIPHTSTPAVLGSSTTCAAS